MSGGGVVGTIFEIRELCFEDGPGPRTTVFFKGCPLRCLWCHNPEGWSPDPQKFILSGEACQHCGLCKEVCPSPENCTFCGRCAAVCPVRRFRICGRKVTVEEAAERILRDRDFLLRSGGGVTFSGGEPLMQMEFFCALADALRPLSIAVETCGYASSADYRRMLDRADFVFQDLKCMDEALHRKLTGAANAGILENVKRLLVSGSPCIIRIPVIPGVNDQPAELERIAAFLSELPHPGLQEVQLLPYHAAGADKYRRLGMAYPLDGVPESPGIPEALQRIFEAKKICCRRKSIR